jgi:hypothetical protein
MEKLTNVIRIHEHESRVRRPEMNPIVTYTFSCYQNGKEVFSYKDPMEAAEIINELFPSQSRKIAELQNVDFHGILPEEIDILHMDPSAQLILKKAIAKCVPIMKESIV